MIRLLLWFAVVAVTLFATQCQAVGVWHGSSTECKDTNEYIYEYTSDEEYFNDDDDIGDEPTMEPQTSRMTLTFGVRCIETGDYDGQEADMYDLADVVATELLGTVVNDLSEDGYDVPEAMDQMNVGLSRYSFHFVMLKAGSNAGAIPAIYYNKSEVDEVANIKKTLAANFQHRSNGTGSMIETDPQSIHRANYVVATESLVKNGNKSNITTMTRTIKDSDVYEFSSAIPDEEINYDRQDQLKLNESILVEATGYTKLRLVPPEVTTKEAVPENLPLQDTMRAKMYKRQTEDNITYDPGVVTNYYNANSTYTMKQSCSNPYRRRKRSDDLIDLSDFIQSTLLTYINQTKKALKTMADLRKNLGDITDTLVELRHDPKKIKLASQVETLVKLEAEYGTTPGYTPVVDDVIDYLYTIIGSSTVKDINARNLLYFILNPEGSVQAQMALVSGLENAADMEEKENILFYLAFMKHPQPQVVAKMEELILAENDKDAKMLRLAYSSMVPRASPELQQQMTSFLLEHLKMDELQKKCLINHILALGNTESLATKDAILNYLKHPETDVQLTAIFALRSLLNDPSVQDTFKNIVLGPQTPVSHIAMVTRSLMYGAEEARFKRSPRPFQSDVVYPLIIRAAQINDEGLHSAVSRYLRAVNSKDSLQLLEYFNWIKSTSYEATNATRLRRGTDWDEDVPVYDLVEPLSERKEDVLKFKKNYAYIWGQKFGCNDISLQIAAGGFAGASNETEYKVFGHAVAQASVYGFHANFIEFTAFRVKTYEIGTHTKLFAYILGKTLKDYDLEQDVEACKTYSYTLYEGKVYTIFDFTYSVFVYVGTLNFGVKATVQFDIGMEIAFCEGIGEVTVSGKLTPSVTFVVGGTGDLEIVAVAKAGITVDVTITYAFSPGINTVVCLNGGELKIKDCVGVYHQWKDSSVNLYAWYAWRGRCGWWFCTGSDAYKTKHKIDALSFTWNIPEKPREALIEYCTDDWVC